MDNKGNKSKLFMSLDDIIKKNKTIPVQIHSTNYKTKNQQETVNLMRTNSTKSFSGMNCGKRISKQCFINGDNGYKNQSNYSNHFKYNHKLSNISSTLDLRTFIGNHKDINIPSYNRHLRHSNSENLSNRPYSRCHPMHKVNYAPRHQLYPTNSNNMNTYKNRIALSEAAVLLHESFNGLNNLAKIILHSNENIRTATPKINDCNHSCMHNVPQSNSATNNHYVMNMGENNIPTSTLNESYDFYTHHPYYIKRRNSNKSVTENGIPSRIVNKENTFSKTNTTIQPSHTLCNEIDMDTLSQLNHTGYGILLEHNPKCHISVPDITDLLSPIGPLTHIEKLDNSSILIFFEKEQDAHYAVCQYNQKYLDGSLLTLTLIRK